jgi:hypothetical protein
MGARSEPSEAALLASSSSTALVRDARVQAPHDGRVHRGHGRARGAAVSARERLRERAAKIDVPEWRESFLCNVPDHARTFELAEKWA